MTPKRGNALVVDNTKANSKGIYMSIMTMKREKFEAFFAHNAILASDTFKTLSRD